MSKWTEKAKTELIERVFRSISANHFRDHKLSPNYCTPISFSRRLGDDVSNFIQAKNPELYDNLRKQNEG